MKIALLFAGQGAQVVGMGKDFYEQFDKVKEIYDAYPTIRDLCFHGPSEKLDDTKFAQSAILLTSYAISRMIENQLEISYVAGLSLGEYSALVYSGVYTLDQAIQITQKRGEIMSRALPKGSSTMAAVLGLDSNTILDVCKEVEGICEIANYNCPGQIVISGETRSIEEASKLLIEKGARRVIPLNVSGAFHSSLLKEASNELRSVLDGMNYKDMNIPVICNLTGKELEGHVSDVLQSQICSSVKFTQSIEYLIEQGVTTFIEVGPGKTLSSFVRKINREMKVYSIDQVSDVDKVLEAMKDGE